MKRDTGSSTLRRVPRRLLYLALALALVALALEAVFVLPKAFEWHPFDYEVYVEMGRAVRAGLDPYGPWRYYPLPTVLWIFVPLSLLPDWFRFVWILGPFVFLLILFRPSGMFHPSGTFRFQGAALYLFTPLWHVVNDAMLEGWLVLPLAWLLANRPVWAGIGGALLLLKPQIASLAVGYMVLHWLAQRDWRNLGACAGTGALLCLPAFVVDPSWVQHWLAAAPLRATHAIGVVPMLTASLWTWWLAGWWGQIVFVFLLGATALLFWHAWVRNQNRAAVMQLLNLLLMPILYAATMFTVAPTLRGWKQIGAVVGVSWGAFLLDRAMGSFGGGYVLIALTALYFQVKDVKP